MTTNNEIMKAIKEKEKKHPFRDWWAENDYKVLRVILFPLWIYAIVQDKITKYLNNKTVWDEKRVDEILQYYIPRRSSWDSNEHTFYFFDNGYGWKIAYAKKYLKRKDRRFWKKYNGFYGGEIREYLIEKFELEGFEKEVLNCYDGWTTLEFKEKENRD